MEIISSLHHEHERTVRVAVLDLYDNVPNQGMRCIKQILDEQNSTDQGIKIHYDVFETRFRNELPDSQAYDIYISTGGPGSPFDGEGKAWEHSYFHLLDKLWAYNQNLHDHKKHVFFICHSFQMMCRYFDIAHVNKRKSTSFGIFPIHKTAEGLDENTFDGLPDPYHAVDSRDWQVTQPDFRKMNELGASILSLEKIRPHVDLERAVMAIRISNEFVGTQYHPEADPIGMSVYFQQEDRKRAVVENHGLQKYEDMIAHLNDPDKITLTYNTIIPNFLRNSMLQLRGEVLSD